MADPGFRQNRDALIESLQQSLDKRDDGESLLFIQGELANSVIRAQEELRKVKRGHRTFETVDERDRFVDASKALVHVLRSIADGIAWRALDYDRAAIHELAFANETGHIEMTTAIEEITSAALFLEEDRTRTVILNDLTNFLRYGDVTIIEDSTVYVHEVKAGKASAGDGRATRQRRRLRKLLDFLNNASGPDPTEHKLHRVRARPVSYQEELSEVIGQARAAGHASSQFSSATAVTIFDVDQVLHLAPDDILMNPFRGSDSVNVFDSSEIIGLFSPNVAPYSIFPLPAADRVDLLMGKLVIVTWLDAAQLMKVVRNRGLNTRLPTKQDFDRLPKNLKPGQIRDHELDVSIGFGNDTHSMLMPVSELGRVGIEFLTEESFADAIEEGLQQAGTQTETLYQAFREEYWLWD